MGHVVRAVLPGVIVGHGNWPAGLPDRSGHAHPALAAEPDPRGEDPRAHGDDKIVGAFVDQVEIAARGPEQGRGALDDRLEQLGRFEAVHQRDRRVVQGAQVGLSGHDALDVVASRARLQPEELRVGAGDELGLGPAIGREAGDADSYRDLRPVVRGQGRDRPLDPRGDFAGLQPGQRAEDDRELVPTVAIGPVPGPDRTDDRVGDRLQQRVAGRVTLGVVEALERIEVEHHHGEGLVAGLVESQTQVALERAVVTQAGERVMVRPDLHRQVRLGVLEGDRGLPTEELGQLELVFGEMRLVAADPGHVQGADHLAPDVERDDQH